jgi:hypothetical protein
MQHDLRRVRHEAMVRLSESVSSNGRLPASWQEHTEGIAGTADIDLVNTLCMQAATYMNSDDIDRWLAPRLHCALRISRATASDDGFWAWLAMQNVALVEARFKKNAGKVHPWRYRGVWSRNALGRLWWGAEMTRNGPDYSATDACFTRTRTAQFALELMYSWDRAAAIAFAITAEAPGRGERLSDDQLRLLSTRLKVLLPLRALGITEQAEEEDSFDFDPEWASHTPTFGELVKSEVGSLIGPSTGKCSVARIEYLLSWFQAILSAESPSEVVNA